MCWWKIPPKKTIYIVGLCKADNYEGMTGLVKCCAITQQREGMMSNKRLGDVWNSKNVASSIACMTQTWQIMSSETGANESTTSGSKHSYEPWIGDILGKDLQITSFLCTCFRKSTTENKCWEVTLIPQIWDCHWMPSISKNKLSYKSYNFSQFCQGRFRIAVRSHWLSGTWLLWSDARTGTQHIHILAHCLMWLLPT